MLDNGHELTDRKKPMQNKLIQNFNGRFRDECLDERWFTSLGQARCLIEQLRMDSTQERRSDVA